MTGANAAIHIAHDPLAPPPPERVMRIAPLDMRQQRFRTAMRGFDRTEVVAFLTEAADDYEHALREIDRLRQDLARSEALLVEHREREDNLRNTLAHRAAARRRDQGVGAERGAADRPRGAGTRRPARCRRRRAASRRSSATSTSCGSAAGTPRARSRRRSRRSIARSSSSANRTDVRRGPVHRPRQATSIRARPRRVIDAVSRRRMRRRSSRSKSGSVAAGSARTRARRQTASTALCAIRLAAAPVGRRGQRRAHRASSPTCSTSPAAQISIVSGEKSRDKVVVVSGDSPTRYDEAVSLYFRRDRLSRHVRHADPPTLPAADHLRRAGAAARRATGRDSRSSPTARSPSRASGSSSPARPAELRVAPSPSHAATRDRRRRRSARSCRASSTRTRTRCSRATGATSCAGGWPGRPTREIAADGGGIVSTVRATRARDRGRARRRVAGAPRRDARVRHDDLRDQERLRARRLETELKMLRAIDELDAAHPIDIVPTFMGAHEVPSSIATGATTTSDSIIEEMIPAVARPELAEWCDVFCETGVFTPDESTRILEAGVARGPRSRASTPTSSGPAADRRSPLPSARARPIT